METTRPSLLVRVGQDQPDAWREFDMIYRPMLCRFARSQGLGEDDSEDVTQFCMGAVHKHIKGFDYDPSKGRFKGWLRTLVNNRVRNLHRKRRDKAAETADFRREQARERSPEEDFDAIWMEEHLKQCIRMVRLEVAAATFEAFKRHVLDECPVADVCEQLGMTPNQVYKIKWRVTQKLNEKMKELFGDCQEL